VPGQFGERGAESPAAVGVAGEQPVHLEAGREAVRRRARQPGAVAQFREPAW
jgi:hypothetical protein